MRSLFIVGEILLVTTGSIEPLLINVDDVVHMFKTRITTSIQCLKHGQAVPHTSLLVLIGQAELKFICVPTEIPLLITVEQSAFLDT